MRKLLFLIVLLCACRTPMLTFAPKPNGEIRCVGWATEKDLHIEHAEGPSLTGFAVYWYLKINSVIHPSERPAKFTDCVPSIVLGAQAACVGDCRDADGASVWVTPAPPPPPTQILITCPDGRALLTENATCAGSK